MWFYGTVEVSEAIGKLVEKATELILESSVDGEVYIEIEEDGAYRVSQASKGGK